MIKSIRQLAAWAANQFVCIYGCGFAGTYDEVQAHQSAAHPYGK